MDIILKTKKTKSLNDSEICRSFIKVNEVDMFPSLMPRFAKNYKKPNDMFPHTAGSKITYVHSVFEHRWAQRVIRFYDLDKHIIEVGENLKIVCKRFLDSGLNMKETVKRVDVRIKFVQACAR